MWEEFVKAHLFRGEGEEFESFDSVREAQLLADPGDRIEMVRPDGSRQFATVNEAGDLILESPQTGALPDDIRELEED